MKRSSDEELAGNDSTPPKLEKIDKYGSSGIPVPMVANFFPLERSPDFALGQFRLDFVPDAEVTQTRKCWVRRNEKILGLTHYTFDGASLYTASPLKNGTFQCTFEANGEVKPLTIEVRQTGVVRTSDDMGKQVLNLILRDAMAKLNLICVKRNYFDAKQRTAIPEGKLELWPGYLTSIRSYEGDDVLLCVEIIHKFMRNETVYDIMDRLILTNKNNWQDLFKKEVVGTTVLTDYTNKTYRVDDIDFTTTPQSKFKTLLGEEQSYMEYYKAKYGITIKDHRQMMLISRARERDRRAGQPENIYLVPELSRATGLTDSMRANFKLMQAISGHTRLNPTDRVRELLNFNKRLQSTPESMRVLTQWHMTLSPELVKFTARELAVESIIFGQGATEMANAKAEWAIKGRMSMYSVVDCSRWVFLYPRSLENEANLFLKAFHQAGRNMNYPITEPLMRAINDDRQESYIREIDSVVEKKPKLIVIALPTNRADRYAAVKVRTMVQLGIPCQVVLKRTMNHKNLISVATKIAIQVNCKLGGIPWMIKLPIKGLMTVGFDVSHHPRDKERSLGALCATMDLQKSSSFYSTTMAYKTGNEMVESIDRYFVEACRMYKEICNELPDRIVLYRDGVGEGQIKVIEEQEIRPILDTLTRIYAVENRTPKFAYIVVNKRVNARFFKKIGSEQYINPRPGTVMDKVITLPGVEDFYLVSQNVGQGTVAPTYYNILHNSVNLSTDKLQILTYKMCHLYYNWGGTTRLPCVSQNAKKLAFLTSQSLQQPVHENLKKTLYFL